MGPASSRPHRWVFFLGPITWLGLSVVVLGAPPKSPPTMNADARLNDVFFVDDKNGWAVGDRGLILSTHDGGRHWLEQTGPEAATLRSVYFADAQRGWVVGGFVEPYRHTSRAVIWRTEDGGRRWTPVQAATLPALRRIRMTDRLAGWAVGDASPLYPAGVFRTKDGGKSWSTVPVGRAQGLLTGDFVSDRRGVIAGENGQLRVVVGDESVETRTPDLGSRPLQCIRMLDIRRGWLVGGDGLILSTKDGGLSWRRAADSIPVDGFDFHACAVRGSSVWIAGAPGSIIFHSDDDGRTWTASRTGVSTPIRAMHFVSTRVGWAVGALGAVLHTTDGGRSWTTQRQGGERVAVWMVSPNHEAPLEAVANFGGGDGYLSRLTVLFPSPNQEKFLASARDRVHEAAVTAGGSLGDVAWQFTVPDQSLIQSHAAARSRITRMHDGQGERELLAYLVGQIRQWRPSVIIAASQPNNPFAGVMVEQLQLAVSEAADPTRHTDQIAIRGLSTHRVSRLFMQSANGSVELQSSRLLTNVGRSAGGMAAYGRGLLHEKFAPHAETVALTSIQNGDASRGLFTGIRGLAPGQGARREQGPPQVANLTQLHRMIQQARNARELLREQENIETAQEKMVAQLDGLTAAVDTNSAAEISFQLANSLRRSGKLQSAADLMDRMLRKYPDSPHSDAAAVWLVQYYASKEMRQQENQSQGMVAGVGAVRIAGAATSIDATGLSGRDPAVKPAGFKGEVDIQPATVRSSSSTLDRRRAERALAYAQTIQQTRPGLYDDPRLRFSVAAAQRTLGRLRPADSFYRRYADPDSPTGWRESAALELWMSHKQGRPPKTLLPCFLSPQRPVLDGQLNDRLWKTATPIDLKASTGAAADGLATRVFAAYDAEHLYLAAVCQTKESPPAGKGPRQRDANLQNRDRLQFFIDVNRDYSSFYTLEVDDRGWGSDACFDDTHWNPRWHIAHATMNRLWMVEMAIPLKELTGRPSVEGEVWAFGVQRVTPDEAVQSWLQPASVQPRPEGFGAISFDLEK